MLKYKNINKVINDSFKKKIILLFQYSNACFATACIVNYTVVLAHNAGVLHLVIKT